MCDKLDFPLKWDYVRAAPLADLQISLRTWLQRVKPACLLHPHGFYVVLLRRADGEEWRLHYWPRGKRLVTGMPAYIHTHNCHVESRILKGRLSNSLHDVSSVETGGQPLYKVNYAGDRYVAATSNSLQRTAARVLTRVRQEDTYCIGDMYHVERDAYHEARVSEQDATSTLVCMHERRPSPVMVVGLDGYPDEIKFTRAEQGTLDFGEWV
ncbi:hypothetical protein A9R05_22225 [Burkholderia sp. KK1]|nr:hypothetical protein A9R05_22225 [Burkholderia sp. KK1]